MTPLNAIKSGVMNTFQISTRASRPEYWWFAGIVLLVMSAVIVWVTPTQSNNVVTDGFMPLASLRAHIMQSIHALPMWSLVICVVLLFSVFTISIRRLNDIHWSRFKSITLMTLTIGLVAAFTAGTADEFAFVITRTFYAAVTTETTTVERAFLIILALSPAFIVTLTADLFLMIFGAVILTVSAALSLLFLVIKLAAPSALDSTPNEVPS